MRIEELIKNIKKRPAMYLGGNSILRLKSFVDGYYFAICSYEVEIYEGELWRDFQDWVAKRYDIYSSQNWSDIILFFSIDEYEALNEFFKLFDEFLTLRKSRENCNENK
jgi:hypothetical protein